MPSPTKRWIGVHNYMEKIHQKSESQKDRKITSVETANASVYTYLPNGMTQRFKTVEGKEYGPQAVLVYVPDYVWIVNNAPAEILRKLGDREAEYEKIILEYVHAPRKKVYVVDANGRKLESNEEVLKTDGPIFLALMSGDTVDIAIPVSPEPKLGFSTFDTRKYRDEKTGKIVRESHLGNKVVRINLEDADALANEAMDRGA